VRSMSNNSAAKTEAFDLFADRMTITTPQGGREMESLHAWGRVRARRHQEGATMFGEWLTYVPKTPTQPEKMILSGSPLAIVDAGRKVATQEQILFYEKPDPETGRMVQYQKIVGGKRGAKIVVDERPR